MTLSRCVGRIPGVPSRPVVESAAPADRISGRDRRSVPAPACCRHRGAHRPVWAASDRRIYGMAAARCEKKVEAFCRSRRSRIRGSCASGWGGVSSVVNSFVLSESVRIAPPNHRIDPVPSRGGGVQSLRGPDGRTSLTMAAELLERAGLHEPPAQDGAAHGAARAAPTLRVENVNSSRPRSMAETWRRTRSCGGALGSQTPRVVAPPYGAALMPPSAVAKGIPSGRIRYFLLHPAEPAFGRFCDPV